MITAGTVLAAEDSDKAGPIGLLVIILLAIACYFLYRSMSRHLRRVREQFPEPSTPDDTSTTSDPSSVDTSTPDIVDTSTTTDGGPRPRFVPPVRPTHAVSRPDDPAQQ